MGVGGNRDKKVKLMDLHVSVLTYTGLCGGLEHLKIATRLRGERFESLKVEYAIYKPYRSCLFLL
jgi:hypothetical protein